jgi:hypothetical protein
MRRAGPPTTCPRCLRIVRNATDSFGIATWEAAPGGPWRLLPDGLMRRVGINAGGTYRLHDCDALDAGDAQASLPI